LGGDETTGGGVSTNNATDHSLLIKETRTLVKAYQDEIDHLTKRCKISDTAFTDMHHAFYPMNPLTNDMENNQNILDPRSVLVKCQSHLDAQANQVHHLLRGMAEIQKEMEESETKAREWKGKADSLEKKVQEYVKKEESWNSSKNSKAEEDRETLNNNTSTTSGTASWSKEEREELIRLRREVAEYEVEFRSLKNQDITIKKLHAKIEDLQQSREEEIQRELK
jgi:homeobox protein cut-like